MCNNDRPSFGSDFHGFADYPFTFESYPDHVRRPMAPNFRVEAQADTETAFRLQ